MKKILLTGGSGFIGTNLLIELLRQGHEVLNFDLNPPQKNDHLCFWNCGDIMNARAIQQAVADFSPQWVIHLAGRTDCDENTTVEKGYLSNTIGTQNLLNAIKDSQSLERTIITSSQYVCGPGRLPTSDTDYFPHTVYGRSKVETELLTRNASIPNTWILIRPVNIWGPYHARYGREFWKIASLGLYFHPDVPPPTRTYGYVGNVVWQIIKLLAQDANKVHQKVFYVGDRPIKIDQWSLGFNRQLCGREAPKIPLRLLKSMALMGDGISWFMRRPFFITSSRLKSMTVDYLAPMNETIALLGDAPYSLEDGIRETVSWYRSQKSNLSD